MKETQNGQREPVVPTLEPLTGHPCLAGMLSGMSLSADWAAPAITPNPLPDGKASLQDLTDRMNILLQAQALSLAALSELLQALREGREGSRL